MVSRKRLGTLSTALHLTAAEEGHQQLGLKDLGWRCEGRWGNQPGNLPVGVAPVGLVGVVAGASVDSMGLLPQQ